MDPYSASSRPFYHILCLTSIVPFSRSDAILSAILNRLSQVTPADSHGCLLDACIEATEQYE